MIVIVRQGAWELIDAPQSIEEAWELADQLTEQTEIPHYVGKI